jgi:hypothetical protein
MKYAIVNSIGLVIKYPADPRYDFTYISFPENWEGGKIENCNYVKVFETEPPPCKLGWKPKEITPIYNGRWEQEWTTEFVGFDELKTLITEKRYEVETGGIKIGKYIFKTDRNSQTKYSTMALNNKEVNWKVSEFEFVKADMRGIDKLVRAHVQKCFDKECEYFDIVDSGIEYIEKTDFSLGWPSNN